MQEFSCPRCTKATTAAVKHFFAQAAAPGISVLGCNGRGELMLDLCHISYRSRMHGEAGLDYWDAILQSPFRMRLALESEWGKYANLKQSLIDLLDDAQKLALVRADAKALIFATRSTADRMQFVTRVQAVRGATSDPAPWLWIDLPWDASASNPPAYDVLSA